MKMAAKNSFCLDEEELSCPICFEEFNLCEKNRQPKLLLCLHTFCLACVETLRKYDGSLQCSICRTAHQVYKVGDLMDNYVIFEHLRFKQECEDEKLAAQLKEEYETSIRLLKEQEERDAQLARAEDEKNRLEEEEEEERHRREEVRRQAEEERNRREEARREEDEEQRRLEEEVMAEINSLPVMAKQIPEEIESSSESLDVDSEETTESENEDSEDDGDEPFQDLDGAQNENGEEDEEEETSEASVADPDDYETLSSDDSEEDRCSTEIVSSDDEDEMGTALSTTAPLPSRNQRTSCDHSPSTSPEPDLLSEEFSGVAQPHTPSKPPQETLDKLIPSVKCAERADGSIIILDSSTDDVSTENGTPSPRNPHKIFLDVSGLTVSMDMPEEEDPGNYSSSEEKNHLRAADGVRQKALRRECGVSAATRENDENCKLQ